MSVKQAVRLMDYYWPCGDVAQAQGGVGALAERAGLNREHLYRGAFKSQQTKARQPDGYYLRSGVSAEVRLYQVVAQQLPPVNPVSLIWKPDHIYEECDSYGKYKSHD